MRKLNQLGALSLHTLLPIVIVIALVGGVGAYVLSKSGASSTSGSTAYSDAKTSYSYNKCTDISLKRSGYVYASAIGTWSKYKAARNSDSIRNIAKKLCEKGYLRADIAHKYYYSGNYYYTLKDAYAKYQRSLGYSGKDADGLPGKTSLIKLGLKPIGY
jgi:uncharacterized protein (UPF0333 family)